jgi:hypothetical protein
MVARPILAVTGGEGSGGRGPGSEGVAGDRFEAKIGVEAHRDRASHDSGIGWRRNSNDDRDQRAMAPARGSGSRDELARNSWR